MDLRILIDVIGSQDLDHFVWSEDFNLWFFVSQDLSFDLRI